MSTAQARVNEAARLGAVAARSFLSEHRELLASFNWSDVEKALGSWLQLHARTEIEQAAPSIDLYLRLQRVGFLALLDKGVIAPVAAITSLGQKDLDSMRRATGIGVANLPAPVVVKTPEELFEEQVINDWKTLPSDQFRAKCNNDRKYRDVFKRLSETDAIKVRAQVSQSDEQLAAEVQTAYRTMPGKEFQAKRRNSPAFNAMFEKLCNENRISL